MITKPCELTAETVKMQSTSMKTLPVNSENCDFTPPETTFVNNLATPEDLLLIHDHQTLWINSENCENAIKINEHIASSHLQRLPWASSNSGRWWQWDPDWRGIQRADKPSSLDWAPIRQKPSEAVRNSENCDFTPPDYTRRLIADTRSPNPMN